jgi:Mn-containing catalase
MIQRTDRPGVELPAPSEHDPDGTAAVQELIGGRCGKMSTFLKYGSSRSKCRGGVADVVV